MLTETERVNPFYASMSLSPSYILLCNSLALSGIEPLLGMEVSWDDRHQPNLCFSPRLRRLPWYRGSFLMENLVLSPSSCEWLSGYGSDLSPYALC